MEIWETMRAIFIRHAESTGNLDIPANDLSQIGLTERGHTQAVALAETWTDHPELIALSPYLRTRLTAEPTMHRFPGVPVEVLPMQEFTYFRAWAAGVEPRAANASRTSTLTGRLAEPDYCDGPGAESFSDLA